MRWLIARFLFFPTLGWNMLLGRVLKVRCWWDAIDEQIIIGAFPFSRDVAGLYDEGVRAVVNTCEEYAGPGREYEQRGIVQLRVPTIDFTPPSLESVERGVAFIREQVKNGRVYVHCKAGRGRSATVVVCWLIASRGMTPEEAQALLLRKRPHANRHIAEREVVQQFFANQQRSTTS